MDYLRFLRDNAPWLTAGFVLSMTSSFGQTFFISIFAGVIQSEFSLSHGAWGGIYTLGTAASAIAMVWAGVLTDRFRVRHLGAVVLGLLSLSCLLMSVVSGPLMLIFVIFALRFTGQGMISHLAIVGTARWFVATRGRALSIVSMGFAVGQAILPVVFVALLAVKPWRSLWVMAAGLALIVVPAMMLLLRSERTPQAVAEVSHAVGMDGRHWVRAELIRHWLFWLMVPTLLGPAAWGTALFFQQVHLAEVKGWTHVEFVALFPLFTAVSIASTFASGWALDKVGTNRLMPFYLLPFVIAFLMLSQAESLFAASFAMMVLGLGVGAGATLPGAFWAEHFGTGNLGSIKAMAAAVMVLGSAIGPGVTGWLIDFGIDFPDQMIGIAAYFVLASALATIGVRKARDMLPSPAKVDIISA
ncbi:MAG: MFS transporter [Paracoccaceae bacterium]